MKTVEARDGSPPGSSVLGILQARTLEWVAISFSNAWKWKVKVKSFIHVWLFATPWTAADQAPSFMGVSRQEYWSGLPLPSLRNNRRGTYTWAKGFVTTTKKFDCKKAVFLKLLLESDQCRILGKSSIKKSVKTMCHQWIQMAFWRRLSFKGKLGKESSITIADPVESDLWWYV